MEPVYILILAIAGMLTTALTLLKIFSMRRINPGPTGCFAHGQIETEIEMVKEQVAKKQSVKLCNDRTQNIKETLDKGHAQFKMVNDTLVEQGLLLARMDKAIEYLAIQNGFGKRKS